MNSIQEQPNAKDAEDAQKAQKVREDEVATIVIGSAIEVQRQLGTGLLESAYSAALAIELQFRGLRFVREAPLLATYKGQALGIGYRADFLVEECVLVELKAVDAVSDLHRAQLLSYLRLARLHLGLLLNFHAIPVAGRGLTRVVNQL